MPTIYVQRGCPNGLQVLKFQQSAPFIEAYEIQIPSSLLGLSLSTLLENRSHEDGRFHITYKAQSVEPGSTPLQMAHSLVTTGRYRESSQRIYEELERRYLNA